MSPSQQQALKAYGAVGAHSQVVNADPLKLVQLLYANMIERLAAIRGNVERGEVVQKCEHVDKISQILGELNGSLDLEKGGDVAKNLRGLYEYMMLRLVHAHANNDLAAFEEIATHLRKLKTGWDTIATTPRVAVGQ
jgi:flagellar secretion chaperone FliS